MRANVVIAAAFGDAATAAITPARTNAHINSLHRLPRSRGA
jgi:hypothetical protein